MTSQQIREKTSARKVLAVLVGLLASLLALEGLATVRSGGGFEAFAQATGTAPTIELINPDTTTSDEISARHDGVDSTYDLVAWVSNPPTNAVVQFSYTPSGSNQPEIGIICSNTGTRNAALVAPDTYECDWDLGGINDGGGTVRAELYDEGTGKVAEDEEPVVIDSTGQTVEILYPAQGESVGFYTGPDGIATAMIDVTTSGANADDDGTTQVNVYYSTAAPGTEPVFELCGRESTTAGSQDSIRCDLLEDDPDTPENEADPSRVTAIAAVAAENGPLPRDPVTGVDPDEDLDAADAHRAFGYEQQPGTVTVSPQTQTAQAGTCSNIITATVLDTTGRRIVGINVDVHAAGPTDNLFFDDDDSSGSNTSRHKAPENHATEPSANCEDTTPPPNFNGTQGEHDRVDADLKHIESTATSASNGTNEQGEFTFQLYSIDAGGTQFTVWADEDGDDIYCTDEAAGIGSIGWNETPPSPTGVEAAQACPTPTETATATPTETATATPTETAAPTECSDGQDNDNDGRTDMDDPDCDSPEDDSESPEGGNQVQSGPCQGFQEGSRQPKADGSGVVIVGTPGPDDLRGGSGNDLICGLGGRDAIRGRGGADELYGGGGHDDMRGNAGNDFMAGNAGLDVMRGGAGKDVVKGGGQDDTIRGYNGRDRLVGGPGNDTLRGNRHNDRIFGNKGDDLLGGGAGFDRCRPGPGSDTKTGCES